MIKAAIFDFNGTLINDHKYNKEAWSIILAKIQEGHELVNPSALSKYHSMDYQMLTVNFEAYGIPYDKSKINQLCIEKEKIYQGLATKDHVELVKGAPELLDYLKENKVLLNLATSSIDYNCDWYFDYFKIDRWFDRNLIAHDDNSYVNKTKMYQDAAKRIGVNMNEVLVFEDTERSIDEAIAAGCEKIVYINSRKIELHRKEIIQEIKDFTEFDFSLLK